MSAILDFWRMSTSHDNGSGTIEKLDPENMGIAVGILLLCALELERDPDYVMSDDGDDDDDDHPLRKKKKSG